MIRVLVADSTTEGRASIVGLLRDDPMLEVLGEVEDGVAAVEAAGTLGPDVIVMDIALRPGGMEATSEIMQCHPTPIVMVSDHAGDRERQAFEALAAGALVLVGKPPLTGAARPAEARRLLATVKLMAEVKVVRRWRSGRPSASPRAVVPVPDRRHVRVVAIGASAGGPPTVAEILKGLPASLPFPVLLVQHIADGFAAGLADWLNRSVGLRVRLAEHGIMARPGEVYVARDGWQMGIGHSGHLELTDGDVVDGFRPSASHLLRSVAESYGADAVGVLLTGMGRDGAAGLLELRRRGGLTIAQDKESSVVFGMPGEAVRLGAAEHVLPPHQIVETLRALLRDQRVAR